MGTNTTRHRGGNMDESIRRLAVIDEISKRLEALAHARGVPTAQSDRLKEEANTLAWAHASLKQKHCLDILLVVGDEDIVSDVRAGKPYTTVDGVSFGIVFLDDVLEQTIRNRYIDPNWQGNALPSDRIPAWIYAKKYFASTLNGNKVLFVFGMVDKERMHPSTYDVAEKEAGNSLRELFSSLKWDERRAV